MWRGEHTSTSAVELKWPRNTIAGSWWCACCLLQEFQSVVAQKVELTNRNQENRQHRGTANNAAREAIRWGAEGLHDTNSTHEGKHGVNATLRPSILAVTAFRGRR